MDEKRTDMDDLMISVSRLVKICNDIIDECQRNGVDPVQLETAVSAVEFYTNKMRH